MRRSIMVCGFALATLALAACTPAAVAADAVILDDAISKTAADVAAWRGNPGAEPLIAAVADDASALKAAIAQLRADLGAGAPPAKVASALRDAEQLAKNLTAPDPAGADHLVAEADAVRDEAAAIAAGL